MDTDVIVNQIATHLGLDPDNYQNWTLLRDGMAHKIDDIFGDLNGAKRRIAELEAQLFRANFLISYLANAMDKNTGAEPSVSVEHHALTELLEYANSLTGEE